MTEAAHTHEHEVFSRTIFGFWLYVMSDCALFAALFATYGVLHTNTFGGPTAKELFNLPSVLVETLILLTSSFTCGLALLSITAMKKVRALFFFAITFILGAAFLTLELREFAHFINEGATWQRSGFLSAFFTLVGTHGAHITVGLFWLILMMIQLIRQGINPNVYRRLTCFSLFWHFLDLVWIFIFTLVYFVGAQW